MTNTKHSPLPWEEFDGDIFSDGFGLATCFGDDGLDLANAALIVCAVNAMPTFEKLLKEAHRSYGFLETYYFGEHEIVGPLRKAIEAAEEALK